MSRFILQPIIVAIVVAFMLNRAAAKGEDGFDTLLNKVPWLTDYSHEHHDVLGHVFLIYYFFAQNCTFCCSI